MLEIRNCKDCGQSFTLTKDNIQFYSQKKLELPKRCIPCRKAKRKKPVEFEDEA